MSSEPLTYKQAVSIVRAAIGKDIEIVDISHEEALAFYLDMLFGPGPHHPITRDTTERLLLYCELLHTPVSSVEPNNYITFKITKEKKLTGFAS